MGAWLAEQSLSQPSPRALYLLCICVKTSYIINIGILEVLQNTEQKQVFQATLME